MSDIRNLLFLPLTFYSLSCAPTESGVTTTITETSLTTTTTTISETAAATTSTTTSTTTTTTPIPVPCTDQKTGIDVGYCGEDFTLLNSKEEAVSLYDFAGDVILLDLSGFT